MRKPCACSRRGSKNSRHNSAPRAPAFSPQRGEGGRRPDEGWSGLQSHSRATLGRLTTPHPWSLSPLRGEGKRTGALFPADNLLQPCAPALHETNEKRVLSARSSCPLLCMPGGPITTLGNIALMSQPSPKNIADIILNRRQVYGLDEDSHIRQAANHLTAKALFEILSRLDDESADFASQLSALLSEFGGGEVSSLIGFDTGDIPTADGEADTPHPAKPTEYFLRLVFRDEDAAYYQFPLFPHLEADYVLGAARKRAGAVQHIRIELSRPEALQTFLESCRSNPHFLRVEESTADEFQRAPSNAI